MTGARDLLAWHHGIALAYDDPAGGGRPVPDETLALILRGLGADPAAPPRGRPAPRRMTVPDSARCWLPAGLAKAPAWGLFCQLYELRSDRNWGIGDFADLAELARIAGAAGADFLGINPVHALFLAAPDRRSPFFPSNRRFLNPLYIAPDLVPGVVVPPGLARLRAADLVDYPAVAAAKLGALRAGFDAGHGRDGLDGFARTEGPALRRHALFEAISARMAQDGHGAGWRGWPLPLRDPGGDAVARLAAELADDVAFHIWLQRIARDQLAAAARAARDAGMRIGLYLDLAVGEAPDGSASWAGDAAALPGVTIGAPPDMFAAEGQNWALAAPSPAALARAGFAPFRAVVAAQLRDAGALRIDHAMALWQLFLIPEGAPPAAGTHLRFPFPDLLRALAELSHRHGALIVGEDLGFVPPGFRAAMDRANILSCRILVFEQTARGFRPPGRYPPKALASLSTHDLPILAAWWRGDDIALRAAHGLVGAAESQRHVAFRDRERAALLRAFRRAGVLERAARPDPAAMPPGLTDAAHRFLARTPSLLAGVRLADLAGPEAPTNLPGTVDAYPNWRPKCPVPLDRLADRLAPTAALMRAEGRGRPGTTP